MAARKNEESQKTSQSEAIRQVLIVNPDMKAKDVVAALAEKGVTVKAGMVYFVKGQIEGKKKPGNAKKKANKEVATAAESNGTTKINMSEAIRQVLDTNPDMKAKDVVSTLAAKGIEVKQGLVHLIKGKLKGRQHRKEKARKVGTKTAVTTQVSVNGDATVSVILQIRSLAAQVGGMDKLRELVDALS